MGDYKTILVGIDFSSRTEVALEAAEILAQRTGAERIHLVNVVQPAPPWAAGALGGYAGAYEVAWSAAYEAANRALAEIPVPKTRAVITREARLGPIAWELVSTATEKSADIIVIAAARHGPIGRFVLGSTSDLLLRTSNRPVLVVGPDRRLAREPESVIAAVDLSPISRRVLEEARSLAHDARRMRVVSVFEMRSTFRALERHLPHNVDPAEALASIEHRYRADLVELVERSSARGASITIETEGVAKEIILREANASKPDLIAIGTSGHTAWQRMTLGSTAARVVADAPCPVLVVPHNAHMQGGTIS